MEDDRRPSAGPEPSRRRIGRLVRRRMGAAPKVLLFAQVVHVIGDAAVAAGLAATLFFDVPVGEARIEVGLYLLLAFAPYAVLAPIVAPIVARRARAHGGVVVVSDALRAVLAVLLVGRLDGPLLYPIGFAILVLSRTHAVSRAALVPALVEEEDLLDANASISFVSGIAGVIGGGAALALSIVVGAPAVLLLAGAVFATGTLTGLWLHPPAKERPDIEDKGWLSEIESLRITVAVLAGRLCLGFTAMLVAFSFHGPDDRLSFILAGVALGVGTWTASLVAPALRPRVPRLGLATGALAVLLVVAAATSPLDGLAVALPLAATVGLAGGMVRLAFDAHVQDRWPPAARGPGYARYETLLQLGWVIGAAPGSFLQLSLPAGAAVVAVIAGTGVVLVSVGPRIGHRRTTTVRGRSGPSRT